MMTVLFLRSSAVTSSLYPMRGIPMTKTKPVILGLGNPLFQDEGLGVYCIARLAEAGIHEKAELVDGGTDALALLGVVEEASLLLVIDAIAADAPAGTICRVSGEEIPLLTSGRMSAHQIGFQEVLALASLRGKSPAELVLIGVQPESLDWGTELTPAVTATIPVLVEMVQQQLAAWSA